MPERALSVLIVDDEPPARRGLRRLLGALDANVVVSGEAGRLAEAMALAREAPPDVVFLDVELGAERGFDLIGQLSPAPAIVFVSAHGAYALRAFEVDAVDYLQKPVSAARLAATLERLRQRLRQPQEPPPPLAAPEQRLYLRTTNQTIALLASDIAMLAAEGDFTRIYTNDGRRHLVCRLLGRLAEELPSPPFSRLSRSLIVNLDRVESLRSQGNGRSLLSLGPQLPPAPLGRAPTNRLRQLLPLRPARIGLDGVEET